jgi:mono/diheme cytochrome c family protein
MTMRGWPLLVAAMVGCQVRGLHVQAILELEGDPDSGEELFTEHCAECHGYGSDPAEGLSAEQITEQILYGETENVYVYMPDFWDTLADQQIADIVAYVTDRSM